MSSGEGESARRDGLPWLPISIAIGTSLAVGIPVLMLRRAKAASLRLALENHSTAPPRRVLPSSAAAAHPRYHIRSLPTASSPAVKTSSSSDWDSSPSLLTAMSSATASDAFLAGKAFLIATALVGVGAFSFVVTAQHLTDTYTVPDFARRMRYLANKYLSGVKDRIYRGPENDEERKASHKVVPFGTLNEEGWSWEEAEKRLKKAYDQGGFTLWTKMALREIEAEARIERAKRQREIVAEENAHSKEA